MRIKYFVFTAIIIPTLLAGCLPSEKEFNNRYGLFLKYPSRWSVSEINKGDSYFASWKDTSNDTGLFLAFYPANPNDLNYSCETLRADEKPYLGELVTCGIIKINGNKYMKAEVARNYGNKDQYINFTLTGIIEDNFLKISSGYYKKDAEERKRIEKIFQSFTFDDRATKPLLTEQFVDIANGPNLLIDYHFQIHPDSMNYYSDVVKLVNLKGKTSTLLPLQNFRGGFSYLLPTNEMLYVSRPFGDGKGGNSDFRLYSLERKTDELVAQAPSDESFNEDSLIIEKFNKNLGQIEMLNASNDESGARYLLDLQHKKVHKIGEGAVGFFECIVDPDGTCGNAAEKSSQAFKKFIEANGLNLELLPRLIQDNSDKKMNHYRTPSCEKYFDVLKGLETPTSHIVGCI